MKQIIKLFVILLFLSGVLFLTGCSGGSGHTSVHYGVYGGYGYPHHGYGYHHDHDYDRPDRPDKPDRPDRPIHKPKPDRPSVKPVSRPRPASMGRPSGRRR